MIQKNPASLEKRISLYRIDVIDANKNIYKSIYPELGKETKVNKKGLDTSITYYINTICQVDFLHNDISYGVYKYNYDDGFENG